MTPKPSNAKHAATYRAKQAARVKAMREALQSVSDQAVDWYKKANGRVAGIQDDSGEKCWIIPDDVVREVRLALAPQGEK